MRAFWYAVLLVASVTASQVHHIYEEASHDSDLESELETLEHELYSSDLESDLETMQHSGHLRSRHHKRASLVGTVPARLLPGHHALVDRALSAMPAEVQELERKQSTVNEAQDRLRGSVNDASLHMADPAKIKRSIAKKQAELRKALRLHHNLEDDMKQIENAHSALASSAHKTNDPNYEKARARLKRKQAGVNDEKSALKYWSDQVQHVKLEAQEAVLDEKAAAKKVLELQGRSQFALQQEDIAERKAQYNKQIADEEVASLKYAERQFDKEESRFVVAQQTAKDVEQQNQGRDSMRAMEEVEDAQRAMRAEKDEAENWKTNRDHIAEQVTDLIKQQKASHTNLLDAEAQVGFAKNEQAVSEKQLLLKRKVTAQELRALKYVETKYAGEASRVKVAEAAAKSAEHSVQKLDAIRGVEEEKVHHQLAKGKTKLHKKMKKEEDADTQTASEIDTLEKQYTNWQQEQQTRSQLVDETQKESAVAAEAYRAEQQGAFTKAQEKAFQYELASSRGGPMAGSWTNEEQL